MLDKPKRKHDSQILFKLKLTLIAIIIGTLIATFYPMIWLAPPFFALTPFVYIGLSLLWIPIVWRVLRRVTWDRVVNGLMVACLVSSVFMTTIFYQRMASLNLRCNVPYTIESNTYTCNTTSEYWNWCPTYYFSATRIGNVLITGDNPWEESLCLAYMF
jgi:hypothetical protein